MKFNSGKLPRVSASTLRRQAIDHVEPFELLSTPVYLFLPKNEKFVCYKSPFDFFTPDDLIKLKSFETIYVSPFVDRTQPFEDAARRMRYLLERGDGTALDELAPASYTISDSTLRSVAALWAPVISGAREVLGIETFFAVVFANALVAPLSSELLRASREMDPDLYETGILRSGLVVFLALHLGYLDLNLLSAIRYRVFMQTLELDFGISFVPFHVELTELTEWVEKFIPENTVGLLTTDHFSSHSSRLEQRINGRLKRLRTELVNPEARLSSVYGDSGIVLKEGGENVA